MNQCAEVSLRKLAHFIAAHRPNNSLVIFPLPPPQPADLVARSRRRTVTLRMSPVASA